MNSLASECGKGTVTGIAFVLEIYFSNACLCCGWHTLAWADGHYLWLRDVQFQSCGSVSTEVFCPVWGTSCIFVNQTYIIGISLILNGDASCCDNAVFFLVESSVQTNSIGLKQSPWSTSQPISKARESLLAIPFTAALACLYRLPWSGLQAYWVCRIWWVLVAGRNASHCQMLLSSPQIGILHIPPTQLGPCWLPLGCTGILCIHVLVGSHFGSLELCYLPQQCGGAVC